MQQMTWNLLVWELQCVCIYSPYIIDVSDYVKAYITINLTFFFVLIWKVVLHNSSTILTFPIKSLTSVQKNPSLTQINFMLIGADFMFSPFMQMK